MYYGSNYKHEESIAKKPSKKTLSNYRNVQENLKLILGDQYIDDVNLWVFKSKPYFCCNGCLLPKKGGDLRDIMIEEKIAKLDNNEEFNLWKELNRDKSPIDFFNQAVIHEYGHVWLYNNTKNTLSSTIKLEVPNEINEAFAYMLGDFITGTKTDLFTPVYGLTLLTGNFEKSKLLTYYYNNLKNIANISGVKSFDRLFWINYLKEHSQKQ